MEEMKLKQAIKTIGDVYWEIATLLTSTNPANPSATNDMLEDGEGVKRYAESVLAANQFTQPELNTLLGVTRRFSRHLSEVEETVFEEIGGEKLDQVKSLVSKDGDAYNFIYYYPESK